MPVRICVAIRERTTEAAVSAAMRASEWADLVEIRADYIRNLDIRRLLREKPCPIIFTLRGRSEGGVFSGPEKSRLEILLRAAEEGADYVDVEFSAFWKAITDRVPGDRVILSYHDFVTTPQSLETTLDAMSLTDAGILKIATRARSLSDNLRIAKLLEYAKGRRRNVIALAMGREGIPSRILGPYWGSWATFSSLPGGEPTADGQVPADEMVNRYRVRQIGARDAALRSLGKTVGPFPFAPDPQRRFCRKRNERRLSYRWRPAAWMIFLSFTSVIHSRAPASRSLSKRKPTRTPTVFPFPQKEAGP